MVSIVREPTFSTGISVLVVVYVLAFEVCVIGLQSINQVMLPYDEKESET